MSKENLSRQLRETVAEIEKHKPLKPQVGLILGSGLGDFADGFEDAVKIATSSLPHYPKSTVSGHKGYLVFGRHKGVNLLAVQGRTHFYEGYSLQKVSYVVDIMHAMGVKLLMVTNAAGSTNPRFIPGDLMLITDQVNFFFNSPLRGIAQFSDMSTPYSDDLHPAIERCALDNGINLKKGVLWASSGPTYETSAEVQMIRRMGGDAASMSTAPEVIRANALGLQTVGLSCITNFATGISSARLSHDDVTETAQKVKSTFTTLVSKIIEDVFKPLIPQL